MAWMIARRSFVLMALAACTRAPRFLAYDGPEVTQIRVYKTERRMELWHDDQVLRSYEIGPVSYTHLTLPTSDLV